MSQPVPTAASSASSQQGKVHIVGLLPVSTFNWSGSEDRRQVSEDFAAMRDLFREAQDAEWLAGTDWESENLDFRRPIIDDSDPHAHPVSVSTVSPTCLKTSFTLSLFRRVEQKAREEDTVVVVLCGQAEEDNGDLIISRGPDPGDYEDVLRREEVERLLKGVSVPSERVFLFLLSDPRASGRWKSLSWTLCAPGGSAQTSAATLTCAELEQMRGSVYSLVKPMSNSPIRASTEEVLQHLQVFEPSAPIPRVEAPPLVIHPLSREEKILLRDLATAHNKVGYANTGRDVSVNAMAQEVARRDGQRLSERDQRYLLECLRYRQRECRRADAIARHFGWTSTIPVDKWCRAQGLEQMEKAEVFGAAIASEFFLGPKVGGALVGGAGPAARKENCRPAAV
ncbi:hypothetical protein MSAN_00889500 [Mycena sanguinolenta]|uniref:Uncharacterized protein n=1 Tax=Mycena sanguinolenta TaxID=230812 RepID=A0A8H6YSE8_9AGAR|nr:hypothetical protein MSAN_00889500 [Mycena sanguinolenta]